MTTNKCFISYGNELINQMQENCSNKSNGQTICYTAKTIMYTHFHIYIHISAIFINIFIH